MEGMQTTPRSRLEKMKEQIRSVPASPDKAAQMSVSIDCAVEIAEALVGLTVAVQSMEKNSVTVMNNLIAEIKTATSQAKASAEESGKVAAESANLSRKLNGLTKWIVATAIASSIAAGVQAWAAWYNINHQLKAPAPASSPAPPNSPQRPASPQKR
jgi:prophage DNA circulation protein